MRPWYRISGVLSSTIEFPFKIKGLHGVARRDFAVFWPFLTAFFSLKSRAYRGLRGSLESGVYIRNPLYNQGSILETPYIISVILTSPQDTLARSVDVQRKRILRILWDPLGSQYRAHRENPPGLVLWLGCGGQLSYISPIWVCNSHYTIGRSELQAK